MSQKVIVSGPTGGAPNRLEIRDFIKNDKFFSLYIQALRMPHPVCYCRAGANIVFRGDTKGRTDCYAPDVVFPNWRHSRPSLHSLEWRQAYRRLDLGWLLHPRVGSVPDLASPVYVALRSEYIVT